MSCPETSIIENDTTRSATEEAHDIENAPSGSGIEGKIIKYLNAGKYKIGFIEDANHGVIGIYSIEIAKNFYSTDQLIKKSNYWDVEEYYDQEK